MRKYNYCAKRPFNLSQVPEPGDRRCDLETLLAIQQLIEEEDDVAVALDIVRKRARQLGFIRSSYHFTPVFDGPTSPRTTIYADGFPEAWLALYEDPDFRKYDPIPVATFEHGAMLFWKDALANLEGQPEVVAYAKLMSEHGIEHGFGVPLYGPHSRNGYASFDFGRPATRDDKTAILRIRLLSQIAHQRVCVLLDREKDKPVLSNRETEVLHWMAAGKSATDIGTILDISAETVRTYTQRVYAKLNAADRIGAVVKALKLGLITS